MSASSTAAAKSALQQASGGRRALLAIVVLALASAGCGTIGGGADAGADSSAVVATRTLPPCTNVTVTVPDAQFPKIVPLPDGSVVTANETPAGGGSSITLLAPMTMAELGAFLESAFPGAGLELGDGEAEPNELEQSFSGAGVAGQLTARHSDDCPGVVTIRIAVRES